jgi:hypothetical protein
MAIDWQPTNGCEQLITRLFLGTLYASAARYPMEERNIINIGLHVIKRCRMYAEEYKAWIGIKNAGQQFPAPSRCSTPSKCSGPTPSPSSIRPASRPCNMATAWRPWTMTAAPLHCMASPLQTLAPRMQPHKRWSIARPTAYQPSKRRWWGSSSSAWPSDNSSHHPTTSTMPPNSNSIVTTTAGTTMEAEAAVATTAMAAATSNNQPCTKANKVVAVGLCIPPCPTSNGCRRPFRYVPYKVTFVPYNGTFGASDRGQTLDV